jgi:hypothetical protein
MAIVRFRPFSQAVDSFRDFGDMQAEVNRLFDNFLGRPSAARAWSALGSGGGYVRDQDAVVAAELPASTRRTSTLIVERAERPRRGQ